MRRLPILALIAASFALTASAMDPNDTRLLTLPTVEVEQAPAEAIAGRDPQLERAIQVVLDELKKNPPKTPQRPPYPVRVKK